MPTANLKVKRDEGASAKERQGPEPVNRAVLHREQVHDRRMVRQELRMVVSGAVEKYECRVE
jgi:hypothetical protein